MTFGDRVRSNRIKNNMSQKELAVLLNVTPQTISKWENDLSEPGFQMITDMTNIFKVSHDDLFVGNTDIIYKGSIYTARKDTRMKKGYNFFLGFFAFLSLAMIITTSYVFSLEILTWHFSLGFTAFTLLLLTLLFMTSIWRNIYYETSNDLIDVYRDKVLIKDDNLTIYISNIKVLKIKKYNFITGINIYDDTGYMKILTNDNQKIVIRDISELSDLRIVINKMKADKTKEENQ